MVSQSPFGRRVTKDSGHREEFATGARRDTGEKPKPLVGTNPIWVQVMYPGFVFDRSQPLNTDFEMMEGGKSDLTPALALNRLEALFRRGAVKYGEHNWQKGIPLQRYYESLSRHVIQAWAGDTSEDHLAAIMWNAAAIMVTEHRIKNGELPAELGNAGALYYKDDNG